MAPHQTTFRETLVACDLVAVNALRLLDVFGGDINN